MPFNIERARGFMSLEEVPASNGKEKREGHHEFQEKRDRIVTLKHYNNVKIN